MQTYERRVGRRMGRENRLWVAPDQQYGGGGDMGGPTHTYVPYPMQYPMYVPGPMYPQYPPDYHSEHQMMVMYPYMPMPPPQHAGHQNGWPVPNVYPPSTMRPPPPSQRSARQTRKADLQVNSHSPRPAAPPPPAKLTQQEPPAPDVLSDASSDESDAWSTPKHTTRTPPQCPEGVSGWASLTEGILQVVIRRLQELDLKHSRLVCVHWKAVVDHNIEVLSPNSMKSKQIVTLFSNLKTLHLTSCANIRNRDLLILSRSNLKLQTLTLGDDTNKPWVTNRGLASISKIATLTCLNLQDCNSVTNNGLASLSNLGSLNRLSLKGCRKLTNCGLEALQHATSLTSLSLFGCIRISDRGLLPLTGLNLESLTLGLTRVKDEGMSYIAQMTSLTALHFSNEEMTELGLKQLSTLTQLQCLALCDCCEVSGEALSFLISQLPFLQSLNLYKNWEFDDSQLARCLEYLCNVTFLDLRGTWVTEEGVSQLTKLTNLQQLRLAPHHEMWCDYLCVLSKLTQLTSLTINNCSSISFHLMESLRHLSNLQELDLSDDAYSENLATKDTISPMVIEAFGMLTNLTSVDLSRRPIYEEHAIVLAERLPKLQTLTVAGCPLLLGEISNLQKRFPDLVINRKCMQGELQMGYANGVA